MNAGAATVISEGFLKGSFDVLDAMLALSFTRTPLDMQDLEPGLLEEYLGRYRFVMRAKVRSGGAVALLFTEADAAKFSSLVIGSADPDKTTVDDADLATLREIAEPCLGGGITNLMEKFGRNVEQPDAVAVMCAGAEGADELSGFLGGAVTVVPFAFVAHPELDSKGILLFAQQLETMVPANLAKQAAERMGGGLAAAPELSEAEMNDILSGFSPESDPGHADRPVQATQPPPANLDMVLDIRLIATVRLGHVELPIGDVLALGPGSIIPVGHLVDDPVELLVNDKLVARGDVVVVDEKFGLRITEIVSPKERIETMR